MRPLKIGKMSAFDAQFFMSSEQMYHKKYSTAIVHGILFV
jgi:hypothetical protein